MNEEIALPKIGERYITFPTYAIYRVMYLLNGNHVWVQDIANNSSRAIHWAIEGQYYLRLPEKGEIYKGRAQKDTYKVVWVGKDKDDCCLKCVRTGFEVHVVWSRHFKSFERVVQ
jgi:hypothetical protein